MSFYSVITSHLVMKRANNEEDLDNYLSELTPEECFFQFGTPYFDGLLDGYDFTSLGVICYALYLKGSAEFVGYVGIKPFDDDPECGELEYFIAPKFRDKGYCTEAAEMLIRLFQAGRLNGFEGKSVTAEIISENDASARVLEKLGFKKNAIGFRLHFTTNPDEDDACEIMAAHSATLYELDLTSDEDGVATAKPDIPYKQVLLAA